MGKHKSHKKKKRHSKRSSSLSSSSYEDKRKYKSHKKKKNRSKRSRSSSLDDYKNDKKKLKIQQPLENLNFNDQLPKGEVYVGPTRPSVADLCENEQVHKTETPVLSSETYGPALPPILLNKSKDVLNESNNSNEKIADLFNQDKDISVEEKNDSDEDIIGPLLPSSDGTINEVQAKLDYRAELLRIEMLQNKEENAQVNNREEWMLELPEEKSIGLGLSARKFKSNYSGDKKNRSLWTETPNSNSTNNKKEMLNDNDKSELFEEHSIKQRDEEMDKVIKNYSKEESKKSLLEMHQENMKNEKQTETKERRPFDRNVDLQANRFDEAQKKSIIKKAQLLDSRFSQGQSKYL